MKNFRQKNKKGFVLLYAILTAGVVLAIGLILNNIIVKQLVLSSIASESQISYYVADGARNCARYLFEKDAFGRSSWNGTVYSYAPPEKDITEFSCGEQELQSATLVTPGYFPLPSDPPQKTISYSFSQNLGDSGHANCANVIVGAGVGSQFKGIYIIASGLNTDCDGSSPRQVERTVFSID